MSRCPFRNGATTTSDDAGNARLQPESGILSFPQPGSTRRSSNLRLGPEPSAAPPAERFCSPSGIAGAAHRHSVAPVDACWKQHGTHRPDESGAGAVTGEWQPGRRTARIDAAISAGRTGGSRPLRAVRQQNGCLTSWQPDLATGSGNARNNAGRIAALNAMRGEALSPMNWGGRRWGSRPGIRANQMAVERQRGLSQLANTRLASQTRWRSRPPSVWPGKGAENNKDSGRDRGREGETARHQTACCRRSTLAILARSARRGDGNRGWRREAKQQEKATPTSSIPTLRAGLCGSMGPPGQPDVLDRADRTYKPVRTSSAPDVRPSSGMSPQALQEKQVGYGRGWPAWA